MAIDNSADNLMVVLRESIGSNKSDEALVRTGKAWATLSNGQEVEFEMASFEFIGDMHIRFVFDAEQHMEGAIPEDLARLKLTPYEALERAVANIKRVYGNPIARPRTGGLMQVQGNSPDLDSSYLLDRDFWRSLLKQHPTGLVVAVPSRGGLMFAPLKETGSVEYLRQASAGLYDCSDWMRVSSALYLFKEDRWTVFDPPRTH